MRSLVDTINHMLSQIPIEFTVLRCELDKISHTAEFAAPETIPSLWREASRALSRAFGNDLAKMTPWMLIALRFWIHTNKPT